MGKLRTYNFDRFDGGIASTPREANATNGSFAHIKHFDIFSDAKKLIPMPDFQAQDGTSEIAKNFDALGLGGNSTEAYISGKGLMNWYSRNWNKRVKITPTGHDTTATDFLMFDLSNLDTTVWDDIHASDIRITESDGITERATYVSQLDIGAETGFLYIMGNVDASGFYLYFDNDEAPVYSADNDLGQYETFSSLQTFHTFDDLTNERGTDLTNNGYDFSGYTQVTGNTGDASTAVGQTATTPNYGNNFTLYAHIDRNNDTTGRIDITSDIQVNIDGGNTAEVVVDFPGDPNQSATGTEAIEANAFFTFCMTLDGSVLKTYVDGVLDIDTDLGSSSVDWDTSGNIAFNTNWAVDNLITDNAIKDIDWVTTYDSMLTDNSTFWTEGAVEPFSSHSATYGGFQLYRKEHGDTDWKEVINSVGRLAKDIEYEALPSPIYQRTEHFYTSSENTSTEIPYITTLGPASVFTPQVLSLGTFSKQHQIIRLGRDNQIYSNDLSDKLYQISASAGTATLAFDAGKTIRSFSNFGEAIALATGDENENNIELWDFARGNPFSVIPFDDGECRVIGAIGQTLIGVSARYIETSEATRGKGFLSVQIAGNDEPLEVVALEVAERFTKSEPHDLLLLPFSFLENKRIKFYYKHPYASSTYHEGIWEVGINSAGRVALSQLLDTNSLGRVHTFWAGAQHYYFTHSNDGSISRLNEADTYTISSSVETGIIGQDEPRIKKQLREVTVGSEPLASGASYELQYRKDGATAWTTIATMSVDGAIRKQFRRIGALPLPTFQELELRLQSDGGACITEFGAVYELLGNV